MKKFVFFIKLLGCSQLVFLIACSSLHQIRPNTPEEPVDVIIIGAGMAGLNAAKELRAAKKSFIVLEAQDRIGGRAMLSDDFSVPLDLGAAWFHGVDDNPLVPIADKLGFHRIDTDLRGPIFVGDRKANETELRACEATSDDLDRSLEKTIKSKKDKPLAELLPANKPCADLIASNIGPLENGIEIEQVSSITAGSFDSDNDDFLEEGIGSFVAAFGKDVPVRLNSIVERISYDEKGVMVTLKNNERFYARRVLLTVSTGVLAAGKIIFNPPLPPWKTEVIKKLPMGLLNKVVMQFKKDIFQDTPKNSWVLWDGPGDDNVAFVIRPLNAPIAVAFYGGKRAKEFEKNDALALSHAKHALTQMYGKSVEEEFEKSALTKWGQNPWTLGAYSYVSPGASKDYEDLRKPVKDRLFFAGEACARPAANGSIHGAYESSIEASKMLIKSLNGQPN